MKKKFVKVVHLVGFITKKFVTMHGHMNVKKTGIDQTPVELIKAKSRSNHFEIHVFNNSVWNEEKLPQKEESNFMPIWKRVIKQIVVVMEAYHFYRGADKSLARPGRKQATATGDFDFNIAYL